MISLGAEKSRLVLSIKIQINIEPYIWRQICMEKAFQCILIHWNLNVIIFAESNVKFAVKYKSNISDYLSKLYAWVLSQMTNFMHFG